MNKTTIIAVLLILLSVSILYFYYRDKDIPLEEIKIDSLKTANDSLSAVNSELMNKIDSLKKEVGKVDSIKIEIDHWYEKNLDSITNQSIADDAHFFSEYLSKINSRFTNSNNSDTIKGDKFNLSRTSEILNGDSSAREKTRFTARREYDTTTVISSKRSTNK